MTSRKCHRIKRILKGSPNEQTHLETENTRIGSSLLREIKQNPKHIFNKPIARIISYAAVTT